MVPKSEIFAIFVGGFFFFVPNKIPSSFVANYFIFDGESGGKKDHPLRIPFFFCGSSFSLMHIFTVSRWKCT